MPRIRRKPEEARTAILDAAEKLLLEQGLSGLKLAKGCTGSWNIASRGSSSLWQCRWTSRSSAPAHQFKSSSLSSQCPR